MIASLMAHVSQHGDKAAMVNISRLQEAQRFIQDLQAKNDINNFQRFILNDLYSFDLPEAGFEVRSILIVASPGPSLIPFLPHWQGKSIQTVLPGSYIRHASYHRRVANYLQPFLESGGYHASYGRSLPHKLLAVRSGLGEYGRNNICYVEGMGSFLNLSTFFTDIPCEEDHWQEVRQMELCQTCRACLKSCPTGAILPDRFLINNERCLTYLNEAGSEYGFPDWVDPASHHTLYGCLRCQMICPANRPYVDNVGGPVELSEAEVAFLMEGKPMQEFPEDLRRKVEAYELFEYMHALPRNLRTLFEQAG